MNERETLENHIESWKWLIEQHQTAIDTAEKKLAELDKPKLRHGDYGSRGKYSPWIKIHDEVHWLCSSQKDISGFPDSYFVNGQISNLVDDTVSSGEDLEEFEVKADGTKSGEGFSANTAGKNIGINCNRWMFSLNQVTEIHQKLGQIIATIKRHQEKTKGS